MRYTLDEVSKRTEWLRDGKYGVMMHFLGGYAESDESWDARVDAFDCEGLADQLASAGAAWLQFTVSQTGGRFCMPISSYAVELAKIGERKRLCSRRDLIADLSEALDKRGIKLVLYVAYECPVVNELRAAYNFVGKNGCGRAYLDDGSQQRYWDMLREISLRYGKKIYGWWVDGCYGYEDFPTTDKAKMLADTLRAGNPEVALSFNSGISMARESDYQDYTTGEENDLEFFPEGRFTDGMQWHALTYLGPWWSESKCSRSTKEIARYVKICTERGGAVTIDVSYDTAGHIVPEHFNQLCAINDTVRRGADPETLADDTEYSASMAALPVPDEIPSGCEDIAAGKAFTCLLSENIGQLVAEPTDGNPDTCWIREVREYKPLLQLDLGAVYKITAAKLTGNGSNNMERRNFALTASNDPDFGTQTELLVQGAFPNKKGAYWAKTLESPVEARYVRLYGGGKFTYIHINGINIYIKK
jgi:Alpha-L-fucosidase./F5/8 type C domain.